jgi:peptidoglycan/LPS O-acetylase OafA/YrhL
VFSAVIGTDTPATVALYVVTAIIAGIAGGIISYLLIERPILGMKERWRASVSRNAMPAIDH